MLLELDLVPGLRLGAFTLGMALSKAVLHVRKHKADYRCVEVKYADQALLEQDIVLNFPEHGLHLRFEPSSQLLRLIEVYDTSRMQLRYGKGLLGGASHAATALLVYELLGATVAGQYDSVARMYPLHYPGLLFLFPIPVQHVQHCKEHAIELPLEFPDNTTPVASRICIYAGSAGSPEEVAAAKPPPLPKGSAHCQPVEAVLGEGLRFVVGGQRVTFGDSPQDVCSEMGCPSSAASKALDHVSRGSTNSTRTAAADYFYSYEDRGVDVLFDGSTNRVKKLVLHTNAPGHADFNAYSKCTFTLFMHSPDVDSPGDDSLQPSQADTPGEEGSRPARESSDAADAQCSQTGSSPGVEGEPAAGRGQALATVRGASAAGSRTGVWGEEESADSATGKGLMGFLEDLMVKSPGPDSAGPPAAAVAPGEEQWEWGGEWTKSLLDMGSDALSLGSGSTQQGAKDAGGSQGLDATHNPDSAAPAETRSYRAEQAADAHLDKDASSMSRTDQRDGWDDMDTAGLELDLNASGEEAPTACHSESDELRDQPPALAPGVPCMRSAAGGSCEDRVAVGAEHTASSDQSNGEGDSLATVGAGGRPEAAGKEASESWTAQVQRQPEITADSCLEEIKAVMGDAGLAVIHTRGLRGSPFGRTQVYGYKGACFEVMGNGHIASMTLFQV